MTLLSGGRDGSVRAGGAAICFLKGYHNLSLHIGSRPGLRNPLPSHPLPGGGEQFLNIIRHHTSPSPLFRPVQYGVWAGLPSGRFVEGEAPRVSSDTQRKTR